MLGCKVCWGVRGGGGERGGEGGWVSHLDEMHVYCSPCFFFFFHKCRVIWCLRCQE